ncbi:zf-HC2 domain-containing protein [Dactylosporangium sp. CA-092794]|uniref:zf-HC2 domain-containing protein n=1 Tax=Dactylosporangium sp. CA-092794 TaxID=3239929 RepID=UPI003D931F2C
MTELQREDDVHGAGALYLLGALDPATEAAFERHLAGCPACQQQCEDFGPAATGLSHLPAADFADLLATPTALGDLATVDFSEPLTPPHLTAVPTPDSPTTPNGTATPRTGPAEKSGPAGDGVGAPEGALASVTPLSSRRRSRRGVLVGLVAAAAVAVGATAVGVSELVTAPGPISPVSASARAEGVGASARLTVTMAARGTGTTTIVASIVGLDPGRRYQLYATTVAGQTFLVADRTGATGAQEVTGEVAAPLAELAFFSVTRDDGTSMVLARVERATPR